MKVDIYMKEVYIYIYESKYGSKSDSINKAEKLSDFDPDLLSYCPFGKSNTKYILHG